MESQHKAKQMLLTLEQGRKTSSENNEVITMNYNCKSPRSEFEFELKRTERLLRMKRRMSESETSPESQGPESKKGSYCHNQCSDLFGDVGSLSPSSGTDDVPCNNDDGSDTDSCGLQIDLGPDSSSVEQLESIKPSETAPIPNPKSTGIEVMKMTPQSDGLAFDQLSPTTQFVLTIAAGCPNPVVKTGIPDGGIMRNVGNFEPLNREDPPKRPYHRRAAVEKSKAVLQPSALPLPLPPFIQQKIMKAYPPSSGQLQITNGIEWDLQAELMYYDYINSVVFNMSAQKIMWDQLQTFQVGISDPPLSLHSAGKKGCCLTDPKRSCQIVRRAKCCFFQRARIIYEFMFPHTTGNDAWLRKVLENMWTDFSAGQKEIIYYDKTSFFYHRTLSMVVKYPPGRFERAFFASYFPKGVPIDPKHLVKLSSPLSPEDPEFKLKYEFFINAFTPKEHNTNTKGRRHWMEALQNKENMQ